MKTMKTTLMTLIAMLSISLSAGTITDSANVFGQSANEVGQALKDLPVWIETSVAIPAGGLKEYADAKIKELSPKGFLVVITTQPRNWRVSMNPIGLASSEGVRIAGDAMTAKFKQGQFAVGAIGLAKELDRLSKPSKAGDNTEFMLFGIIIAMVGIGVLVIVLVAKRTKRRLAHEKLLREELNAQWKDRQEKREAASEPTVPPKLTAKEESNARKLYERYTPEQRERITTQYISHPCYHSGCSNDPLMFYLLMSSINNNPHYIYAAPAPQPVYEAPAPRYEAPARSYSAPARSADSDSSGASGAWSSSSSPSYDSGSSSSSFDSGSSSSSDSSGGGGGW